jgi:hypothetical protein
LSLKRGEDLILEHKKHTKKTNKNICPLYEQQRWGKNEKKFEDLTFTLDDFFDVDQMLSHP